MLQGLVLKALIAAIRIRSLLCLDPRDGTGVCRSRRSRTVGWALLERDFRLAPRL
jgi:hypothetical protein